MRKVMFTGLATLVVLGSGASAIAASPTQLDVSEVHVSFADLDINNSSGAKVLYGRLQQASESVCEVGTFRELGSLSRVAEAEQCYVETLDEAIAKIDSAELKKIHTS
jgi:UrcA family protein